MSKRGRRRWGRSPSTLPFLVLGATELASAQRPPPVLAVGHPERANPGEPLAAVRSYALQRSSQGALLAYVEGDDRGRGTLRLASLRSAAGVFERVGAERTLAPRATTVALWWDGTRGAVVWTVPRPLLSNATRPRRTPAQRPSPLLDPQGPPGLSGGTVWFQRLDAQGAPVGEPLALFEEHSRLAVVAVGPQGDGFRVAWTGGVVANGEVQGTIRSTGVSATGAASIVASDTGFVGSAGSVLRVLPGREAGTARLVWSGQRCWVERGAPAPQPSTVDPSAEVERRNRELLPQQPPHEHPGPPLRCDALALFHATVDLQGATVPVSEGVPLAVDALGASADALLAVTLESSQGARWSSLAPTPRAWQVAPVQSLDAALAAATSPPPVAPSPEGGNAAVPSSVPPPQPPSATELLRRPLRFDVEGSGAGLRVVALSPTMRRGVLTSAEGARSVRLFGAAEALFDASFAPGPGAPWLLLRAGAPLAGPLFLWDLAAGAPPEAPPEVAWAGDERLRVHLLRARAARAQFTSVLGGYGPVFEFNRTDPRLPGMLRQLQQLRIRWRSACDALTERARWLGRQGLSRDLQDLARAQCEIPDDAQLTAAEQGVGASERVPSAR